MKTHRSPRTIVITSSSEVSIIFSIFLGQVHGFSKTSGDRGRDVKGVRSFQVTAAIGCFRMEPRFSRSGLIVAWGAPSKLAHSGHQSCSCKSSNASISRAVKGNPDWHGFKREQKVESLLLNWQDGQNCFHHTLWDQVTRAIGLCCC